MICDTVLRPVSSLGDLIIKELTRGPLLLMGKTPAYFVSTSCWEFRWPKSAAFHSLLLPGTAIQPHSALWDFQVKGRLQSTLHPNSKDTYPSLCWSSFIRVEWGVDEAFLIANQPTGSSFWGPQESSPRLLPQLFYILHMGERFKSL